MPLSNEQRLRYLQLKKKKAESFTPADTSYLSNQIEPGAEPGQASFMQGLGAGLTAQPGEGVGHFIGSALPATIGAIGGPIGAAVGEAARQTVGAIVNPEGTAKKSRLEIGLNVAGAGAFQKAGEAAGPYIGKAVTKAGEAIGSVSDWLATKIGKSFLKASTSLNAYGHKPEKAIIEEGIFAHSWDDLIAKSKIAKDNIAGMYEDLFNSRPKPDYVDISNATHPINVALSEARKYPETNASVINKLSGLKRDVIRRINRSSVEISDYEVKPPNAEMPTEWLNDIQTTFGKDVALTSKNLTVPNKSLQKHWYKGKGTKNNKALSTEVSQADDIFETELVGSRKVVPTEIANNIKREIYKLTKYTGNPSDDAAVNKTKQYVAAQINNEIEKVMPEIKPINIRYGNIIGLENAAEHRAVVASRSNMLGIPEFAATGMLLSGNAPAAIATEVGGRMLTTPIGATSAIKLLSNMPEADLGPVMDFLTQRLGGQLVNQSLSSNEKEK
jgi:hypothetical protein